MGCLTYELVITILCVFSVISVAHLQVGFYQHSCSLAEIIVKEELLVAFLRNSGVAPGLIRLHFHDCFVRGCDGSILIDSPPGTNNTEKHAPPNKSLRVASFEMIDSAKAKIEAICKGVVSCADIIAFAARDSVQLTGGITYEVPAGRKDGRVSLLAEANVNLPSPNTEVNQLTRAFVDKGLTQEDMVTLSGAHTLGRSHCTSIIARLYNFNGSSTVDPTLNPIYAAHLKQRCPPSVDKEAVVPMDPLSPAVSDSSGYYKALLANRGMFTSDQTLTSRSETRAQVVEHGQNQYLWAEKFAAAMVKMGNIGVLTGNAGEIRSNCRVINTKKNRK